jgi:hypothetical protein
MLKERIRRRREAKVVHKVIKLGLDRVISELDASQAWILLDGGKCAICELHWFSSKLCSVIKAAILRGGTALWLYGMDQAQHTYGMVINSLRYLLIFA